MAGEALQRGRSGVRAFASTAYLWMSPVRSLTRFQFVPHAFTSACTISSPLVQSPRSTRGLGHGCGHVAGEVAGLTQGRNNSPASPCMSIYIVQGLLISSRGYRDESLAVRTED